MKDGIWAILRRADINGPFSDPKNPFLSRKSQSAKIFQMLWQKLQDELKLKHSLSSHLLLSCRSIQMMAGLSSADILVTYLDSTVFWSVISIRT